MKENSSLAPQVQGLSSGTVSRQALSLSGQRDSALDKWS